MFKAVEVFFPISTFEAPSTHMANPISTPVPPILCRARGGIPRTQKLWSPLYIVQKLSKVLSLKSGEDQKVDLLAAKLRLRAEILPF